MSNKTTVISSKQGNKQAAIARNKKKKITITCGIIGGVVILSLIVFLIIFLQPKNDPFEASEEIYSKHKISYSRADYNKDRAAIDNNSDDVSDAYNKMKKKNNKIINNILERYGEDPDDPNKPTPVTPEGEDVDMDAWCKALIAQLTASNNYINNHYGLEAVSFITTDEEEHEWDARPLAYEDIANVEKYLAGGAEPTLRFYGYLKPDELGSGLRISAYKQVQYVSDLIDKENKVYLKWFGLKHPVFSKIYTVELSEVTDTIDNTHISTLRGTIVTDNGNYTVYSSLTMNNNRTFSFQFYDVGN